MNSLIETPRVLPCLKPPRRPRIGFLGVGWIGRNRLEAVIKSGLAQIAGIADASETLSREAAEIAAKDAPPVFGSLNELLEQDLDGVVIATPSALHAEQSITALNRGVAVFCQKPLARDCYETQQVVAAARHANRLLGVDLSYRHLSGIQKIRKLLGERQLGKVFAVELQFHNAYGPDKRWFYDKKLSGGGCVIDLGIHLVDLALWALDFPEVDSVSSSLFSEGRPLVDSDKVEDFAAAQFDLRCGTTVQLSCSWRLAVGCDAVISAAFYGANGGAILRNVDGSFFDFTAERCWGTRREILALPPEPWGGRAIVEWTRKLVDNVEYDPEVERIVDVASALDRIYSANRSKLQIQEDLCAS